MFQEEKLSQKKDKERKKTNEETAFGQKRVFHPSVANSA